MIIGFILDLIYAFINFLVNLLPVGSGLPDTWIQAIFTIWGYVNVFSFIVPVDMLVYSLAIAMTFHGFIFAWKGLHWIYSLVRGSRVH